MNSHDPALFRRAAEHFSFQRFSFQHFSSTQNPFSPATPFSPPSGLATGSFNGLNPKRKFLAFYSSILFLVFFSITFLLFYLQRPLLNHDLGGYVGAVLMYEESDPLIVHEETFAILKKHTPEHRYARLAGLSADSKTANRLLGSDPEAFRQSLPFYRVRVAYTTIIYLLTKSGLNPVFASHAISAISVTGSIFLLGFLFTGIPGIALRFLIPFLSLGFGVHELARLSTPDGLGLIFWTLFFFLAIRRKPSAIIILPFLTLIRNDYVLMVALICLFLFFFRTFDRRLIASSFILAFLIHFVINNCFGSYGFLTALHYLKHWGEIAYPENAIPNVSFLDYFRLVWYAIFVPLHPGYGRAFFLFVFTFAIMFLLPMCRPLGGQLLMVSFRISEVQCYSMAGIVYFFAHVFAFPYYEERYFTFIYLFVSCAFFKGLIEAVSNRSTQANEFFQNSFRIHREP